MITNQNQIQATVRHIADSMVAAAITAPKARGVSNMFTGILEDANFAQYGQLSKVITLSDRRKMYFWRFRACQKPRNEYSLLMTTLSSIPKMPKSYTI